MTTKVLASLLGLAVALAIVAAPFSRAAESDSPARVRQQWEYAVYVQTDQMPKPYKWHAPEGTFEFLKVEEFAEYLKLPLPDQPRKTFALIGLMGWELVAINNIPAVRTVEYIFKRPMAPRG